ncbi:YdcF family protein [Paraherbaspirillum soli]|uniref:YdcF family protein n=1 Tax=Paraherbaspirillum soli TaxID=631222 RepID=A0ABW0MC67_9BURK
MIVPDSTAIATRSVSSGACIKAAVSRLLSIALCTAIAIVLVGLGDTYRSQDPCDVALVLGSGAHSYRLKARLDQAAQLYFAGRYRHLIVSGDSKTSGFDEAGVMQEYLVAAGIPASRITIDRAGFDTRASARNTAAVMHAQHYQTVCVVTQYFHIARTRLALRQQGIRRISSSYPPLFELWDVVMAVREAVGFYAYLLRGWLTPA